jgi:uncharacterized protein (DUF362 family)/NAD-dependent dihydropyrimidine dehydrogenase PreA subunit
MRPKVSIVRCADYDRRRIAEAVKRSVDLIGGISRFVKKSARVLIKPNLLSARDPEQAVTTHPEFVRAVARLVKEAGGTPSIGDSPGSFFTIKHIDEVFEKTGMKGVADEESVELVKFDKIIHIDGYPISAALKEYDLVINLPKLKTHTLAMLTGAIKNMYGFLPGLSKVQYHKRSPNIKEFSQTLADIYAITRPGLSIMDGVVGMDGDGPAAGRKRDIGLILAGADGVSLDAVFARMAGLPYEKNILLKEMVKRGLGVGRVEDIDVVGERLDTSRIRDFKLPRTEIVYRFPTFIARHLAKVIYFLPVIDEAVCEKCDICVASCPVDAITINKDTSNIDGNKCVKCFCCHEVCPYDAIFIKKNFLAKLIWR